MPKLSQLTPSRTQRVLIYGPPKTGKTKLAGALAECFNLYYFGLEQGHEVLFQLPAEWQERIEVINIPDTKNNPIGIETMLKVIIGEAVSICSDHGKINCLKCMQGSRPVTNVYLNKLGPDDVVIVDSLTQLTNSALSHIIRKQPEDYKPEWDDWARLGFAMDRFLSSIQQAKYNVVCISHEVGSELEDGKEKIVPVAGTRNFSRNSAKYFDHVVYASIVNGKHQFGSSTLYKNNIMTGSRTNAVLETMENPSLMDIMKGKVITPESAASSTNQTLALNKLKMQLGTGKKL